MPSGIPYFNGDPATIMDWGKFFIVWIAIFLFILGCNVIAPAGMVLIPGSEFVSLE